MKSQLWSVVLAGGAGRRLSSLTGGMPKQFWRPEGGRSLVEETLVRLAPICSTDRTVIVVNEHQRPHVDQWPLVGRRGRVVFQPLDRGTAAGVLFGLVPILTAEPDAAVVITPSDHGIGNPNTFRRGILQAAAHVEQHGGVVLFGVEPSADQSDYGWITMESPNESVEPGSVASFVEKPPPDTARRLRAQGAVWNTMVVVARATTLFDLIREHLPELTACFVGAVTLPPGVRDVFLAQRYPRLPKADFSRGVLARATNLRTTTWPASIGWSDLGTPDRLQQWLDTRQMEPVLITPAPAHAEQPSGPIAVAHAY